MTEIFRILSYKSIKEKNDMKRFTLFILCLVLSVGAYAQQTSPSAEPQITHGKMMLRKSMKLPTILQLCSNAFATRDYSDRSVEGFVEMGISNGKTFVGKLMYEELDDVLSFYNSARDILSDENSKPKMNSELFYVTDSNLKFGLKYKEEDGWMLYIQLDPDDIRSAQLLAPEGIDILLDFFNMAKETVEFLMSDFSK